jgi:hypothetical protein
MAELNNGLPYYPQFYRATARKTASAASLRGLLCLAVFAAASPPQFSFPTLYGAGGVSMYKNNRSEGFMVCYQVLAQFAFFKHKPALVSTSVKKQNAPASLVLSGLPYGYGLKHRRFFKTEKEAARYVSYLHTVYANRTVPASALSDGQLSLF